MKKIISNIALKFFADDLQLVVTNIDLAATNPAFSSIPFEVIALLAAIEDRKFFIHDGYDVLGMIRAVHVFIFRSKLEGASTIEQQLVRVLTDRRELTLYRKFREICLASAVSFLYEKSVIARSYLYYGYYGWRMNGITEATKTLNIRLPSATEYELAELVARLKYPQPQVPSDEYFQKINKRACYALKIRHRMNYSDC